MAKLTAYQADEKGRPTEVVKSETGNGTRIYLLPVETFPGHKNNIYLILRGQYRFLFDTGSGLKKSHKELASRIEEVRQRFGEKITLEEIDNVIISHAHIDHFGGAHAFKDRNAKIYIHELDARVLSNFEERITVASKDIAVFLKRAGVPLERRKELTYMYTASKEFFSSLQPDVRLRQGDILPGDMTVFHTPGHCPGLICLKIDDILMTSDHLCARITPNQMPQSITPFTGLENYLRALDKIDAISGIDLALGGHEAPIQDMYRRIQETRDHHYQRLERCLELATTAHNLQEFADALFGDQMGYGRMLAYTEAGAHIEYLHQMGELVLDNLDEITNQEDPVLYYRKR
jgi:glyoxylase-like metal-dependent hydrolase (beta-lactamase superfamily II)